MEGEMDNVALIPLQNNLQWYRYKIFKKNLHWYQYKMIKHHNLKDDDYERCTCFLSVVSSSVQQLKILSKLRNWGQNQICFN